LSEEKKPVVVYIWLGTCDITDKISQSKGYVDKRYENVGDAIYKILAQYQRVTEFIF
jgi:hypothetical protein